MNASTKVLLLITLTLGVALGITVYGSQVRSAKSEKYISVLEARNARFSARISDLIVSSRAESEQSDRITEGLRGLVTEAGAQVERARSIKDRAQRISYLADAVNKGIDELIVILEASSLSTTSR